ncbi:ATP-binding protein [Kitasatospora sp. LaBMicrA B282]|uniref:ATP-binding protein n=1 Tax=Kitasatospora sp. LaBMicrA B282 TaxID=3420949 RepID=UPI003D0DF538
MPETSSNAPEFTVADSCWLPRSRQSPGAARRLLANLLDKVAYGDRYADVGLLLVSELVTNAVVHGTPRDRLVWVSVGVGEHRLRIEVHDACGDREPVLRAAGPEDESGRGLALVRLLGERWGCCPRRGVGKIVWVECGPVAPGRAA